MPLEQELLPLDSEEAETVHPPPLQTAAAGEPVDRSGDITVINQIVSL